jgi:hypothetical protein
MVQECHDKRAMKIKQLLFVFLISVHALNMHAQKIKQDVDAKSVSIEIPNLALKIDYAQGCRIAQLSVNGTNVLSPSGVYTAIKTDREYSSAQDASGSIKIKKNKDGVTISNIIYGNNQVAETWIFRCKKNKINWTINRQYLTNLSLDDMSFPTWHFADLEVWKGGILDNGGMVWCKYLRKNDTYGVHTGGVTFWNPDTNHALRITPRYDNAQYIASRYTHTEADEFAFTQYVTSTELKQRNHVKRFIAGSPDVFAPFEVRKGKTSISFDLQQVDYSEEYSRGTLPGIDAVAVRELLNTTGRYGVVDSRIVGANGWISNWKCFHEPFFAQIGMALNDKNYTLNLSSTLDQERDLGMLDDGRVLSRWHGNPGQEIPGTYNAETGYHEAKWGYTIDSQPDYVINTAEQFDLCGDIQWLKSHKLSCEKALDWLIKRDSNHNGIFEMMCDNTGEEKCSDWTDIVWVSFENAFVNVQMYEALQLWADCEKVLGDAEKATEYLNVAARLKQAFNRPVNEGGFWHPEKKQYIYWRDKDGSIHGDNMFTPLNFAAIAFRICDDPERIAAILDRIEQRTVAENLFHWPLCFDSFQREEVHILNWPFPKYENGDIFPTWGYLGIRAYVNYDKTIALKYINNLLRQYNKDGLSFQRYSRETQSGLGGDILSGISTTVTALYRDIYGIRPKWNRMGIEPNLSEILNGTEFRYTLRDTVYRLKLSVNDYEMSTDDFSIRSKYAFGASMHGSQLVFYPFNKEEMTMTVSAKSKQPVRIIIDEWNEHDYSWTVTSGSSYQWTMEGLNPDAKYELSANGQPIAISISKNGKANCSYSGDAQFHLYMKNEVLDILREYTGLQNALMDTLAKCSSTRNGAGTPVENILAMIEMAKG